jgi:tungstate transport system substrate-binding protein
MRVFLAAVLLLAAAIPARAQPQVITVAATTSFADSGLAAYLLPKFTAATGVEVNLVSRGSGQAMEWAQKGFVDVLLVNSPEAVAALATSDHVEPPRRLMANKLVIAGPAADPAKVQGAGDLAAALRTIARERAPFVSRSDNSGVHQVERKLWEQAGVRPRLRGGNWYKEPGLGMVETVHLAARLGAYVLTDRGTWLASGERARLPLAIEGPEGFGAQYEVMAMNPRKYPNVKAREAAAFVDWLTSRAGQAAILDYVVDGEPAFVPNAKPGA